ncbi:alpha/beta hydrolase [Rhodobacteraceae bacterium NNCM2]|nr:alpha/beta hydrolase [Coraliihabitans acroporae]
MDWDAAYNNGAAVSDSTHYPPKWRILAEQFRDKMGDHLRPAISYGESQREQFDLFLPAGTPQGLVVFVHGGYWHKFDRDHWSWAAAGPVARGWAVAIPGYTLCPAITITGIGKQIAAAITEAAAVVDGPIRLTGHSAGGHLVTRMLCPGALPPEVAGRIAGTVAISGLPDLRPLMNTEMNRILAITAEEAESESPARLIPEIKAPLICHVGADELPEFRRQNTLLTEWRAHGVPVDVVEAPGRHHFNVIDDLADPHSALVEAVTGSAIRQRVC